MEVHTHFRNFHIDRLSGGGEGGCLSLSDIANVPVKYTDLGRCLGSFNISGKYIKVRTRICNVSRDVSISLYIDISILSRARSKEYNLLIPANPC